MVHHLLTTREWHDWKVPNQSRIRESVERLYEGAFEITDELAKRCFRMHDAVHDCMGGLPEGYFKRQSFYDVGLIVDSILCDSRIDHLYKMHFLLSSGELLGDSVLKLEEGVRHAWVGGS